MSRARDLADSADKDIVGTLTVDGITVDGTADATTVEFDNLSGTGAISVTDILDQDDMSSDSATALATQQSIKAYVDTEVAGIVDSAPAALDTLNELAAALGDDVNFSTTVTNSIATKLPLAGGTLSGALDVNATVTADKVDIGNGVAGGTSEILFSDNVSSRGKIIYDHSSNPETLVLQTTGTTALSIDNSQNISIPNGNVDVTGTVTADGLTVQTTNGLNVLLESSNSYQYLQFKNSGETNNFLGFVNDDFTVTNANATTLTVTAEGNVGIGVTPEAWTSGVDALQVGTKAVLSAGSTNTILGNNWYDDGANKYLSGSGALASIYSQNAGVHAWYNAPAGNADAALTFTQAMTLDASGNLYVATTGINPQTLTSGGGLVYAANGSLRIARQAGGATNPMLDINNTGVDDDMVMFRKDGAIIGSIGVIESDRLYIADGNNGLQFDGAVIRPCDNDGDATNNVLSLGTSGARFANLFIGNDIGHLDNGGNARLLYDKSSNLLGNTGTNVTGATVTSSGQIKVTGSNASTVAFSVGDAGTGFFNTGSNSIGLSTGGTESLRVDGNGNLLVGTTAAPISAGLDGVQIYNASSGTQGRINFGKSTTSTVNAIANYNNSGTGTAGYVGGVTYSNTATAFPTSSDQRLKENITNADSAITTINGIQVRKYDWISNSEHERYGLVAQELNDIVPEAVCRNVEEDTWAVDYSKLVPMLTKALQESLARIETLEAAVTVLQGE